MKQLVSTSSLNYNNCIFRFLTHHVYVRFHFQDGCPHEQLSITDDTLPHGDVEIHAPLELYHSVLLVLFTQSLT